MPNKEPLKVQVEMVKGSSFKPAYYRCPMCPGQFRSTANGIVNHLFNKHRPFDFIEIRVVDF